MSEQSTKESGVSNETLEICLDFINPDRGLLEGVEVETDPGLLWKKLDDVNSSAGKKKIKLRISELSQLALVGLFTDYDVESLTKRLSNTSTHSEEETAVKEQMCAVALNRLELEKTVEGFIWRLHLAKSQNSHSKVLSKLHTFIKGRIEGGDDCRADCEAVLKLPLCSWDFVENHLNKINKVLDVDENTDIDILEANLAKAYGKSAQETLKEYIDIAKGVANNINTLDFPLCEAQLGLVVSEAVKKKLQERMETFVKEVDPANPDKWFLEILQREPLYRWDRIFLSCKNISKIKFLKCLVEEKVREIIVANERK
ncbi:hypothetical protein ACFL22_01245 [Patescibacteria group bacterium]